MGKDNIHRNLPSHDENSNRTDSDANNPPPADLDSFIPNTTDGNLLRYNYTSYQNPGLLEQIILAYEDYSPECNTQWCRAQLPPHSCQQIITQPFYPLSIQQDHAYLTHNPNSFLSNPRLCSHYTQQTGNTPPFTSPQMANGENGTNVISKPQSNLTSHEGMRSEVKNINTSENTMDFPHDNEECDHECKVCNRKAKGKNFGLLTCEGCKCLFRRMIRENPQGRIVCDGSCRLRGKAQLKCKECRYQDCLTAGMQRPPIE